MPGGPGCLFLSLVDLPGAVSHPCWAPHLPCLPLLCYLLYWVKVIFTNLHSPYLSLPHSAQCQVHRRRSVSVCWMKKKCPGKSTRALLRHIKWEHNHQLNLFPSKEPYILEAPFWTPRWQGLGEFRVIPIETISSRRSRVKKESICHKQLGQCERMWVARFQGLGGPLSSEQCKYQRKTCPGANVVTQKWTLWQWEGEETGAATSVGYWKGKAAGPEARRLKFSAGIWVSDQGFW